RMEVETTGVRREGATADVERLVPDDQPDQLAVGGVDHTLTALGVGVPLFGVRHRVLFEQTVEIAARDPAWVAFIEISSPAHITVREPENGLLMGEVLDVDAVGTDAPFVDTESRPCAAHGLLFSRQCFWKRT